MSCFSLCVLKGGAAMRYDVLLFDVDDTLLDFGACEQEALHATFARFALPFSPREKQAFHAINDVLWARYEQGEISRDELCRTRFARLFAQMGTAVDPLVFEEAYQHALSLGHALMPHAREVLIGLQGRARVVLASNGVCATQHRRINEAGIRPYVDAVFLSEEIGARKPDPRFFDIVLKALGEPARTRCLMIGDSLRSDIQGAAGAGLDSVWLNPQGKAASMAVQPTYEIKTLLELEEILEVSDDEAEEQRTKAARASRQKQGSNKRLSQIVGKPNDRAKFAKTNFNG